MYTDCCCCRAKYEGRNHFFITGTGTSLSCSFYISKKQMYMTTVQETVNSTAWNHLFNFHGTKYASTGCAETAVALPHSRECTKKPVSGCLNDVSKGTFGVSAEIRNILQEKNRDEGGVSCRFDHITGKINVFYCGQCSTGAVSFVFSVVSTANLVGHNIFTAFVDRHKTHD